MALDDKTTISQATEASSPESNEARARATTEAAREAARVCGRLRGPHCDRDTALVYILFGTGLTLHEVAHLQIRDYLNRDGTVRVNSVVRKEIAFNNQERPLLWASERMQKAIDCYLVGRTRFLKPIRPGMFRGFEPDSCLVMNDAGGSFGGSPLGNRGLSVLCRDIFNRAATREEEKGLNARYARRQFARSLSEIGADINDMKQLLGLSQRRHVYELIGDLAKDKQTRLQKIVQKVV